MANKTSKTRSAKRREYMRRYRAEHREEMREYMREYMRKYSAEHREELRKKNRDEIARKKHERYLSIKHRLDERNKNNITPIELTPTSIEERHKQWKALGQIGHLFLKRVAEILGEKGVERFINTQFKTKGVDING